MGKTVEEMKEEAKKKMQDLKNLKPNQPSADQKYEEAMSKIAFLEAQTKVLSEQLDKRSNSEEEMRLAKEAEALKKNEEALRQEADIAKILNEALKTEPAKKASEDEPEEISQKELAGIIAETVGKALDASSKLTIGEMDKKLQASNVQLAAMQKVMVELLSGLSVNQARSQHPDFDKYREAASKIHQEHPTLSPEMAYQLAKAQAESIQPDKDKIESEKPGEPPAWSPDTPFSTSRGSESSEEKHQAEGNSRQRFRKEVSTAIDNILARRSR